MKKLGSEPGNLLANDLRRDVAQGFSQTRLASFAQPPASFGEQNHKWVPLEPADKVALMSLILGSGS